MKRNLPISQKKKFKYSITFQSFDEESLEAGDSFDSGYEIIDATDFIGDILYKAYFTYGIYMPVAFGTWESTNPLENTDYWEKGIKKYFAIHISNEDETQISKEESDFITFLLSDGHYELNKFREYAVGGIVIGSIALGIGALITYFYFKGKKGNKNGLSNNRAKSITHTINKKDRKFPIKDAWRKEHSLENQSEDYEVPQEERFEMGGDASEHYHEIEYGEGGVARAKDIITKKIGFNEIIADYLVGKSEKFSIWLADSILKDGIEETNSSKKDVLKVFNERSKSVNNNIITSVYSDNIRQILDWLQHPVTPKQDLKQLSFDQALEKAREWHQELQVLGGDIDFTEPETNTILKKYPVNSDGIEYYWVFIPSNYCDLESSRMGHCGRTGYGNNLISLRSVKAYGKGHTINDSHITIAYGVNDGVFYQIKGKKNNKPAEKYFPYIFDLIKSAIQNIDIEYSKPSMKFDKNNKLMPSKSLLDFNGFGSEYGAEEDYGFEDMTKEEIREIYDLKPTLFESAEDNYMLLDAGVITLEEIKKIVEREPETFSSFGNQMKLYERGIITEQPSTTFELKYDCDEVYRLLDVGRDFSDNLVSEILCGDIGELSDSWSYYYENPSDLVSNLNKENEQKVIDEIVRITKLDESVVKENGIEYYLKGDDENFSPNDDFDNIIRSLASAQNQADDSDYYKYLYDAVEKALNELGEVHSLNDEGVKMTIDLSNSMSLKDIAYEMDDYNFSDIEDLFNEKIGEYIDRPSLSIDDRYSPYGSSEDFNEYISDADLEEGYKKGGSLRPKSTTNKKTKIKNMKSTENNFADGGRLTHFNRNISMDSETMSEILKMTNYPLLKEYFVEKNGEIKYDRIKSELEREGVSTGMVNNYLSGLFDGYNYSNTDAFKKEMAKIKLVDKEFYDKVMALYEKISKYPKINVEYAEGGRVTTNDGIIESFLTTNKQLNVGNISTHFNEYDNQMLLRNYGTLIATRIGNDVSITNIKYSKTTTTITNKIKNIALQKRMNVSYVDKFAEGGSADLDYSDIFNVLKSKIDDAIDEIPMAYENSSSFTSEEIEHESRDGFIPYTDGGYQAVWFEYLSGMWGAGRNLPTKPLDDEMNRQIDYNLDFSKENFIKNYPEIVEELGEENIDYNSLYEAGYGEEAEELSNDESEMMSEDTIMMRIFANYYNPENSRAKDGKHTIRLFGDVNLESPYHRTGNLDDSYEVEFAFSSISELEQKMDKGIVKILSWFNGDMYNDSTTEMKVRRMENGGETGGVKFTKLATLGYRREAPKQWRFVDLISTEDFGYPVAVGNIYKNEKELLADLDNFAEIRGYEYAEGGEAREFNYLYLKEVPNGLKLELTDEGINGYKKEEINDMYDLFEDIQANSEIAYIDNAGDMGFGLTEAPIITDGYFYDDMGEFTDEGVQDSKVYVWNDYMIKDLFATLMEQGSVVLTEVNSYADGGETFKEKYIELQGGVDYYSVDYDDVNGQEFRDDFFDTLEEAKLKFDELCEKGKTFEDVPLDNVQLVEVYKSGEYETLNSKMFYDFAKGGEAGKKSLKTKPKKKQPKIVRQYFEDKPYSYAEGGKTGAVSKTKIQITDGEEGRKIATRTLIKENKNGERITYELLVGVFKDKKKGYFEIYATDSDDDEYFYAEGGLWIEGGRVVDYDGVYELSEKLKPLMSALNLNSVDVFAGGGEAGDDENDDDDYAKGGKIKEGDKIGNYSITKYSPIKYDDLGSSTNGLVKLVNQEDFDTILIQYDNALRGGKWFVSKNGILYEGKNPNEVIDKLNLNKMTKIKYLKGFKYENGGLVKYIWVYSKPMDKKIRFSAENMSNDSWIDTKSVVNMSKKEIEVFKKQYNKYGKVYIYDEEDFADGGEAGYSKKERVIDYYYQNDVFDDYETYGLSEDDLNNEDTIVKAIIKYHGLENPENVDERFETLFGDDDDEYAEGGSADAKPIYYENFNENEDGIYLVEFSDGENVIVDFSLSDFADQRTKKYIFQQAINNYEREKNDEYAGGGFVKKDKLQQARDYWKELEGQMSAKQKKFYNELLKKRQPSFEKNFNDSEIAEYINGEIIEQFGVDLGITKYQITGVNWFKLGFKYIAYREAIEEPEFWEEMNEYAEGGLVVNNNTDLQEVAKYMTNAVKKHRWDLKDLIHYFEKDNNFDYKKRVKIWEDMNGYEMKKTYNNIYEMLKRISEANGSKFTEGGDADENFENWIYENYPTFDIDTLHLQEFLEEHYENMLSYNENFKNLQEWLKDDENDDDDYAKGGEIKLRIKNVDSFDKHYDEVGFTKKELSLPKQDSNKNWFTITNDKSIAQQLISDGFVDRFAEGGGVGDYKKVNTFQDIKNDPRVSDAYREDVDEEKMYWMQLKDGFVSIWDSGASIVAENMQYLKDTLNIKGVVITKEEWDKEDDDEYAEGGEVSEWMEQALESLIKETGNEDLDITMVSNNGNEFFAGNDMEEYRVFKTEEDAQETAIEQVREDLKENPDYFAQDWLMNYIDGRDFFEESLNEMNYSYVEDIASETSGTKYNNRLIDELVENGLMDEDDAILENAEEIADELKYDYVLLLTEEKLDEGNNGFDYFINNFGEKETLKMVIKNNLIDIDEASQDAVNVGGIADFISSYDGKTIYLLNNNVAYRNN